MTKSSISIRNNLRGDARTRYLATNIVDDDGQPPHRLALKLNFCVHWCVCEALMQLASTARTRGPQLLNQPGALQLLLNPPMATRRQATIEIKPSARGTDA
jgi:hypothetical protein